MTFAWHSQSYYKKLKKEQSKNKNLVIEGQLKDKIIQDLADDVVELSKPKHEYDTGGND